MSIQTVLDKLDNKEDDVIWLPWVVKNPEPKRRGQRSSSNRDSRYVEYELVERIPIRASALAKCIRDFDAERRAYYAEQGIIDTPLDELHKLDGVSKSA